MNHIWSFYDFHFSCITFAPIYVKQVMASDLEKLVLWVKLSAVMSKYIGETEKNLGKILDSAAASDTIFIFDEADSLLGKSTQVHDANDRYMNTETRYFFQRMEEFTGIVILTTNKQQSMETAFIRRCKFIIEFPCPDNHQRENPWDAKFSERRMKTWGIVWRWFRRALKKA